MTQIQRKNDETYLAFAKRATHALEDGIIDLDTWSNAIVGDNIYSIENTRRCAKFFSQFIENLDDDMIEAIGQGDVDGAIRALEIAKDELKAERIKIQTANLEFNANARADARADMFNERIIEAIDRLKPIKADYNYVCEKSEEIKTGLLCISDLHAGSTYEIKGLHGEIVNRYDYDIMTKRLMLLSMKLYHDYYGGNFKFDRLIISLLGDMLEGVLRPSALIKLREPVIDTTIKLAEFLSVWISKIQEMLEIPVEVIVVGGNHDEVSYPMDKSRNKEENLTKIIAKFIQLRLSDNVNISVEDYSDVFVKNIYGVNVMFEHGVESNLKEAIEFYSNLYEINIDEVYTGHLHRPESKAVGFAPFGDRMVYRVGSICGVDGYAKSLLKANKPSAYFAIYEKGEGHTWSKNYYL